MEQILTAVAPVCIGLLAGVILSFCQTNYVIGSAVSLPRIAIGVLDLVVLFKWDMSIPKVILLSAVLGLFLFREALRFEGEYSILFIQGTSVRCKRAIRPSPVNSPVFSQGVRGVKVTQQGHKFSRF